MVKFSVLAACALVTSAPAIAGDEAAPAAPAADAAAKPKMVCERITEMGSRGYKKVCQTEAQWRAQRESDKRNVGERDRGDR